MKTATAGKRHLKSRAEHLPVHSLATLDFPVLVKAIQHKNPYDFTRAHRHDYFEIFFFKEIAFHLHFDSPASFSQFVKNKTGLTPFCAAKAAGENS